MNASHSNQSVPINNQKVLQDEETKKKIHYRSNTASSYDKRKKIWIILSYHIIVYVSLYVKCKGKRIQTRFAKRSGGVRKIIRP